MAQAERPDLWLIVAIIQPFKLDAVTLALEGLPGFGGMTVTDCRGFGREKLRPQEEDEPGRSGWVGRRDDADVVDFTAKVRLEVAVAGGERAETVVETIARAAHTGRRGDGKILTLPLARAVRVRTGEEHAAAL